MSCIFCQAEMQILKPLANGKNPLSRSVRELFPFGYTIALMLLKSELSSDENCKNATHFSTRKWSCTIHALSAVWQDQVLNTLAVNKYAKGLKARALVHRRNNLTGTKSSVKLSTYGLAWKYDKIHAKCDITNFLTRFGLARALYRLKRA